MKSRILKFAILLTILCTSVEAFSHNTNHAALHADTSSASTITDTQNKLDKECIQHNQSEEDEGEDCSLCPCCGIALPGISNLPTDQEIFLQFHSEQKYTTLIDHSLPLLRPPIG